MEQPFLYQLSCLVVPLIYSATWSSLTECSSKFLPTTFVRHWSHSCLLRVTCLTPITAAQGMVIDETIVNTEEKLVTFFDTLSALSNVSLGVSTNVSCLVYQYANDTNLTAFQTLEQMFSQLANSPLAVVSNHPIFCLNRLVKRYAQLITIISIVQMEPGTQ